MKLSIAIITYNEEENLPRFLNRVCKFADEIVLVDSFSTDKTREIAIANPKVRFFERNFEGFGLQKDYALQQCCGEWVLFLDADEIPDDTAVRSVFETIGNTPVEDVFKIKFINILFGRSMKYGGWANTYRERLLRRSGVSFRPELVHESIKHSGSTGVLQGHILHYTYKSVEHHVTKMNSYSTLMARRMADSGKRTGFLQIFIKQWFQFAKSYLFQLGFLDGIWGYHAAKTLSYYTFLKYMKLYEIQRKSTNKTQ